MGGGGESSGGVVLRFTLGMILRGHKRGVWSVVFSAVDQVRG